MTHQKGKCQQCNSSIESKKGKQFCTKCAKERNRISQYKSAKKWRVKNKEKYEHTKKQWYYKHRDRELNKKRNYKLLKKYGITYQQKLDMIKKQNNKCEICLCKLSLRSGVNNYACVDHDHKNGNIRGILCNSCNKMLGFIEKSIGENKINKAIKYLER